MYLPHSFPHVPHFSSERQNGQSEGGLYGDVIEDLDWSMGMLMTALEELDLLDLEAPSDRIIDGQSILPLILENEDGPHEYIFYNSALTGNVVGVRDSLYKYHEGANGIHVNLIGNFGPAKTLVPQLTNLKLDNEVHNLIRKHPQRADKLREIMLAEQESLDENRRGWQ